MTNPVFHKGLLKHYQVLDRPGTFIVSVSYDVTASSLYTMDEYPRYLIPLRVIRGEDLPKILQIIKDGGVSFHRVRDLFLMGSIFDNDGDIDIDTLPARGEQVVATFDMKDDKLRCSNVKLIDRDNLLYVNFSAIEDLYNLAEKFLK